MLRFKQFIKLLEELNPAQKQSVSSWLGSSTTIPDNQIKASQNAINISRHVIPEDTDHIILPAYSPIISAINEHLKPHGYEIHDYAAGTARKIGEHQKVVSMPLDQLKSRIKKDRIKNPDLQYDAEQHAHNEARKIFTPNELEQYNNVYNSEHGDASPHETAMAQFDDKKRQHYNTIFNLAKQTYIKPHLDKDVTDQEIQNTGFHIKDGIASRIVPTKTESIGKLLENTNANYNLINDFANDNRELGQNIHQYNTVISRNPYHIAECSTNKPWWSCAQMNDDGSITNLASKHLPHEINEGTHVAYLVHKDYQHLPVQQQIDHAISRVLLKPFVSGDGHRILSPENASYTAKEMQTGEGDAKKNVSMINMLKEFTDKHFPLQDDEYAKPGTLYDDDKRTMIYSPAYKKILDKELMKKIHNGYWKPDDITSAIKNNVFSNEHHNALKDAYLERLQSDREISPEEVDHAMKYGYHRDKMHLQALKDNLYRQFSKPNFDMNEMENKLNHAKQHNYFDKRHLDALKIPLLEQINGWDFRDINLAKHHGVWDDKIHNEALHTAFNESMEHFLQHPMTNYLSEILKHSTENDFFDPTLTQKVHNHILDYIKSNDYVDKGIMHNLFESGLLTKDHLKHINDNDKHYYQNKFDRAEKFLNEIKSSRYGIKAEDAINNGYYNTKMHKTPLQDKLTDVLHAAISKNVNPNLVAVNDAIKYGYFDWDKHKKLAQQAILNAMNHSRYDINFAKNNNLWDDDIHKIPFQKQFLEDIKNGNHSISNYENANKESLLTKEHKNALPIGLLKKIQSGKHSMYDINHAQTHGYFSDEHKKALPMALSKQLDDPNVFYGFDDGKTIKGLIEHAINNNYFNDEHKQKITKIFHELLQKDQLTQDHIDHAFLHNYFPKDRKFLEDYYNREK